MNRERMSQKERERMRERGKDSGRNVVEREKSNALSRRWKEKRKGEIRVQLQP